MTDIGRISSGNDVARTEAIGRSHARQNDAARPQFGPGHERPRDVVEVSDEARVAAARLNETNPPIRQDLVDRIKAEIAEGTYESPIKIAGAIDNMLDSLS